MTTDTRRTTRTTRTAATRGKDQTRVPVYVPPLWDPEANRPGCTQALQCPSRRGRWLHYRDGRVERVEEEL